MKYKIYYHDKLMFTASSIADTVKFVKVNRYVIYDEIKHLEDNYINVYCI